MNSFKSFSFKLPFLLQIPKEKGGLREQITKNKCQAKINSQTYRVKIFFVQFCFQLQQCNLWSDYVRLQSVESV